MMTSPGCTVVVVDARECVLKSYMGTWTVLRALRSTRHCGYGRESPRISLAVLLRAQVEVAAAASGRDRQRARPSAERAACRIR